jgi:hypothetical protein
MNKTQIEFLKERFEELKQDIREDTKDILRGDILVYVKSIIDGQEEYEKKETKTYEFSYKTEPCPDLCHLEHDEIEDIKNQAIKEFAEKILEYGRGFNYIHCDNIKLIAKRDYNIEL